MSAHIVEQETINQAITALDAPEFVDIRSRLAEIGINSLHKLGRKMMDMNVDAVDQRYPNIDNPGVVLYDFFPQQVSLVQAYKSLGCWLYQCSEGNVPEQRLYQIMRLYKFDLAMKIVYMLPEYDEAQWD